MPEFHYSLTMYVTQRFEPVLDTYEGNDAEHHRNVCKSGYTYVYI